MKLEAYESAFIVFRRPTGKALAGGVDANYPEPTLLFDLKGPWTVNFNASQRGPSESVAFETLQDWTNSKDDRIKYYSGTAFYNCKFTLVKVPEGKKVIINLGAFTAMAKVTVNNGYAGGLWTAPFNLDITNFIRVGDNDLKIEMVNTWVNRLIGDLKLPKEQRKTWCPVNPYKVDSPLQPSGLFGPVTISTIND